MLARPFALILPTLFMAAPPRGAAPRAWQADVRVRTLEVTEIKRGGPLIVHAVIATESDDEARAVRVEIMLPIGVGVLRVPPGCRPSPSPVSALNARVTCELGDVPVRGSRDVSITTTARVASVPLRIAVFVASDTPDPQPANNFAEKALP
jgi:hypothetical protein